MPLDSDSGEGGEIRVAVVNRGDAAVRFLQAAGEYTDEGRGRLVTVALHVEEEREATFVRMADEARCLGPAMLLDEGTGERRLAYLDLDALRAALISADVAMAWPGWGFVSESAEFIALCDELEIACMAPPAEVVRALGDKVNAKLLAESVGVAPIPWSGGVLADASAAEDAARNLGFPCMVKAAAGGGGRGIRLVESIADVGPAFAAARREAQSAFDDDRVYLERGITGARHVEVQVAADSHGNVWSVGLRDCSAQRRRQKIVEESGALALPAELRERLLTSSRDLVGAAEYRGVGTVEFLVDSDGDPYFMEVNTRLQVEHTVTEMTTGLDLVKLQVDLARGGALGSPPAESGVAIEVRVTAEDPLAEFRPSPGRVSRLRTPTGPGIRTDTGLREGDRVLPEFDPLVMKVIGHGANRDEALARLRRAIDETAVVIESGTTTLGFVRWLLDQEAVRDGEVDIGWVEGLLAAPGPHARDDRAIALVIAATELYDRGHAVERTHLKSTAARGRPALKEADGRDVELAYQGIGYGFNVARTGLGAYEVQTPDGAVTVAAESTPSPVRPVELGGVRVEAAVAAGVAGVQVDIAGTTYAIKAEETGAVRSPSPSVVVAVPARAGSHVEQGDVLVVMESMKMESTITAPCAGEIVEVPAVANRQVDAGELLVRIEAEGESVITDGEGRVSFAAIVGEPAPPAEVDVARRRLLGFDSGQAAFAGEPGSDPATEVEVLALFADACAVGGGPPVRAERVTLPGFGPQDWLFAFLRAPERSRETIPRRYLDRLERVLRTYGAGSLDPGEELDEAILRLARALQRLETVEPLVVDVLVRWRGPSVDLDVFPGRDVLALLESLARSCELLFPTVADHARIVAHERFVLPALGRATAALEGEARGDLELSLRDDEPVMPRLIDNPTDVSTELWRMDAEHAVPAGRLTELLLRRLYRGLPLRGVRLVAGGAAAFADWEARGGPVRVLATRGLPERWEEVRASLADNLPDGARVVIECLIPPGETPAGLERLLADAEPWSWRELNVARLTASSWDGEGGHETLSITRSGPGEKPALRPDLIHPALAERLELWRFEGFEMRLLRHSGNAYLFEAQARGDGADRRYALLGTVAGVSALADRPGETPLVPQLEEAVLDAVMLLRRAQVSVPARARPARCHAELFVQGPWSIESETLRHMARRLSGAARGTAIENFRLRVRGPRDDRDRELELVVSADAGETIVEREPGGIVAPLSAREQRAAKLRRRGLRDPYDLLELLISRPRPDSPAGPSGSFREMDLDADAKLVDVPAERGPGENKAGVVVGVVSNVTAKHPEGMERVVIVSDPSRSLGALAEPECVRIVAALDLAERLALPVEWFSVSSGARISMSSGVENMDWIARALRRIVLFTQAGGEINVIVTGVNVGAQPYFNAEATMLMHTRGILVMTATSSMLLTGKDALDFAGAVSAEDNLGIGGYARVMGPNGQAQYWASSIEEACDVLFRYYEHAYVAAGERFPRPRPTDDDDERDVRSSPHPSLEGTDFESVGDVLSEERNPNRKKPFDMRSLMRATVDADCEPLERWEAMVGAEGAIVWDCHLGGIATSLIGIESKPLPRVGVIPADGPDSWTAGTLFPRSAKKVARAINAASARRPVVVLANLSGFDGSPESLRKLQLEYGAEIARAVTNFSGPFVLCVVSRYHGGAFVVFSKSLNDRMEVLAVQGARASVIGGTAAAAVVFAREVEERVVADPRVAALSERWRGATGEERFQLEEEREVTLTEVREEIRGVVAREFDEEHTIERARRVGSVDRIVPPELLRPELISALRRGVDATLKERQ